MTYNFKKKLIGICFILFQFSFFYAQTSVIANTSKLSSTQVSIEFNEKAINEFKDGVGRYPTSNEGLYVLIFNNENIKGWNGPYRNKKFISQDCWGNDYIYIYPAKYGDKKFDLYSFGVNGLNDFGLKDDVTNWSKINYEYYIKHRNLKIILFILVLIIFIVLLIFLLYLFFYNLKLWSYCKKINNNRDLEITRKGRFGINGLNPIKWLRYIFNELDNENNKILGNKERIRFSLKFSFYLFIVFILNIITLIVIFKV